MIFVLSMFIWYMKLAYNKFTDELWLAAWFELIKLTQLLAKEFNYFEVDVIYILFEDVPEGRARIGIHVKLSRVAALHSDCLFDTVPELGSFLIVQFGIYFSFFQIWKLLLHICYDFLLFLYRYLLPRHLQRGNNQNRVFWFNYGEN